jgi:hypothetical protein
MALFSRKWSKGWQESQSGSTPSVILGIATWRNRPGAVVDHEDISALLGV